MKKWQLLDLVRRVHELTNISEPVIVGSQSLFAIQQLQVSPIVARSVEADFLIAQHRGRDKDFVFLDALLESRLMLLPTLIERAALIQETAAAGALLPRLKKLSDHWRKQVPSTELKPLTELLRTLESPQ